MNSFSVRFGLMAAMVAAMSGCGGPGDDVLPPLPVEADNTHLAATAVINGWTTLTSEEYAPIACGAGNLISSMKCTGGNCDNVAARCTTTNATFGDVYWTKYFSEEGTNSQTCTVGYWMTGLVCRGSSCDDLSVQCTRVSNRAAGTCRWADRQFSEEFPNQYDLPSGWFARGLACTGSKCDNLRVYECVLN
jgi:hypothetical protein